MQTNQVSLVINLPLSSSADFKQGELPVEECFGVIQEGQWKGTVVRIQGVVLEKLAPGQIEYFKGYKLLLNGDDSAVVELIRAAQRKYPPAYLLLDWVYHGILGPENLREMQKWKDRAVQQIKWFEEQAKSNKPEALRDLGLCYLTQDSPDEEEALKARKAELSEQLKSVDSKDRWTQWYLALQQPQIQSRGMELLLKAADLGDTLALIYSAPYYLHTDKQKCIELWEKAAKQSALAEFFLGICYGQKDPKQGIEWFQKAATKNCFWARKSLEELSKTI